jgi:hypothetical protein
MLQVYKIQQDDDNVTVDQQFKMATDGGNRTRRATGVLNFIKPKANLEVGTNFFTVRVMANWNAIPETIQKWHGI